MSVSLKHRRARAAKIPRPVAASSSVCLSSACDLEMLFRSSESSVRRGSSRRSCLSGEITCFIILTPNDLFGTLPCVQLVTKSIQFDVPYHLTLSLYVDWSQNVIGHGNEDEWTELSKWLLWFRQFRSWKLASIWGASYLVISADKVDYANKVRNDAAYLRVPMPSAAGNSSPMSSYNTELSAGGLRMSSPGNSSLLSRWSQNFPLKFKWESFKKDDLTIDLETQS